ncbi:MAG TPA: hypothetical protein ENI70_01155 [Candidatus Peregrinibacteria bacterium]|nr:hypothetical protein [Candidatus Peregrinibacteria bacterium]
MNLQLYFAKGERYANKEKKIQEWIDQDKKRDQHLERVQMTSRCDKCDKEMELFQKDLRIDCEGKKKDYVECVFCCRDCWHFRIFHENGRERFVEKKLCPKCGGKLNCDIQKTKKKKVYQDSCVQCDWKDPDPLTIDLSKTKSKKKSKEDFERDRKKYCLAEKEGREYLESKSHLEGLSELFKRHDQENKEGTIYNKLKKLEKLNLAQLKKKLASACEKEKFTKLDFDKPLEDRGDLLVRFTLQDDKEDRGEHDSENALKKLVKQALSNTNWILMTEGISYKMGLLSGRLRGIEAEEKLLALIKKREKRLK